MLREEVIAKRAKMGPFTLLNNENVGLAKIMRDILVCAKIPRM